MKQWLFRPRSSAEVAANSIDPPAKKQKIATGASTPGKIHRLDSSDVLISGLGGLGVEVAKNVILGGGKSVTLHDDKVASVADLSSQFYLTEADIGKNRAEVSSIHLSRLNNYVPTRVYTGPLSDEYIKGFKMVVLTDSSLDEELRVSEITHANNIALIVAKTRGVFAQIFCDFGEEFKVVGTSGENPDTAVIASVSREEEGVVTCLEHTRHGLEDGDYVTFSEVQGMTELNGSDPSKIKVLSPHSFSTGNTSSLSEYVSGGVVTKVKILNFKKLAESLKEPEFFITDSSKFDHPKQMHVAFAALDSYVKQNNSRPKPWDDESANAFLEVCKTTANTLGCEVDLNANLISKFSKTCMGDINPVNALCGGVVAQEVMKSCEGKFHPIYQWMYYDAIECLPTQELSPKDCPLTGSRYDGQVAVFGKNFQDKLGGLKYFVVGAGAVGCELLKNFAMMGISSKDGEIIVTDMGLIEKSNLNRHFLFRPHDVQKPKSGTAAKAVKRMNPDVNVTPHENRVGVETEKVYDDVFFEKLDGVAIALGDKDAKIYMGGRSKYYRKPLVQSETLGTKGSTQVVVPFLTDLYRSSRDPLGKSIPLRSQKNFPYGIEHTLQWAREAFEGLFKQCAENVTLYLNDSNFIDRTLHLPGAQPIEVIESLKLTLVDERPKKFQDCVTWARNCWQEQFSNQINQLLFDFPPYQLTTSGQLFWSEPKRCPKALDFDVNDSLNLDYVFAAANLKAKMYGLPQVCSRGEVAKMVANVKVPKFIPKSGVKDSKDSVDQDRLIELLKRLPTIEELEELQITPLELNEDDDTNFHMDFMVAASNLRATNYGIPIAGRHSSKLIAGKIIPAIATTTSVVAGLVCMELYKLAAGVNDRAVFKNGVVDLSLPFFCFSEPAAAAEMKYLENEWTLWDRFEVQGEITLVDFVEYFKEKHCLKITCIIPVIMSQGHGTYYPFFVSPNEHQDRLNLPMLEVVRRVSKIELEPHLKSLVFKLSCKSTDGSYLKVPYVLYTLP